MKKAVLLLMLFTLAVQTAQAKHSTPFAAGHKSACLAYDQIGWDPKHGDSLRLLVDLGYFPPGVDFAVSQLAYSLSTSKEVDPVNGSSRLLVSQIWYPVNHADAKSSPQTTHIDFFTNDPAQAALARSLSQILNIGGAFSYDESDYPNAPIDYGLTLGTNPTVAEFITDGPANSVESAPIAASHGPFPVIILDSPSHEQYGLAEQLAARGYVVIAPTHPNDQLYEGLLDIGQPGLDGLPIGGIPYGLICDTVQIDAAKPVNGVLDFTTDVADTWLADDGIYLGTLALGSDIQRTLQLRAIDIGVLIERAGELFSEPNVVDLEKVGVLGFSLGGNTAQLLVSDDSALADSSVVPLEARAGLDRVDAVVSLAGNNRFIGSSSNASLLLKPTLALQGRQDLVVNLGPGSGYPQPTLDEPNSILFDNYVNRYAPNVPAMRVLIDRFGHTDFRSSEPLVACFEHGGSTAVPSDCLAARPIDERFSIVEGMTGDLEIGGSFLARPLQERLDIATFYSAAWFDLYVKGENCSDNPDIEIDGRKIPGKLNNVKRLSKNLFDASSIDSSARDLLAGDILPKQKQNKACSKPKSKDKSSKHEKSRKSKKSGKSKKSEKHHKRTKGRD